MLSIQARATRPLFALAVGALAALLAWSPVWASVSWSGLTVASQDDSYAGPLNALGRTVTSGGTAYLHAAYTRETIGGDPVQNDGPYLGVYYRRGNSSGSNWSGTKRLNATAEHGDAATLATSGKYVYVAWRSQSSYDPAGFDPATATGIKFVRNTSHGSSTAWSARKTLVSGGLVDRPSITATGSRVYLAYTDMPSNEIRLWRSDDYGVNWTYLDAIAAADRSYGIYKAGFPVVAATGTHVAVAWNTGDGVRIRYSSNYGASFGEPWTLTDEPTWEFNMAHRSGRIAAVAITSTKGVLQVYDNGSIQQLRQFATFSPTGTHKLGYGPAVGISGTTVAVAWASCLNILLGPIRPGGQLTDTCAATSTDGIKLRWRESSNLGATWKTPDTIATYSTTSTRRRNDVPSIVLASATRRIILFNGSSSAFGTYKLYTRLGTGTK